MNLRTTGNQSDPTVAMDPSGRFVVAWTSESQDGAGYAVIGRRFTRTGAALAAEFQVNTLDGE